MPRYRSWHLRSLRAVPVLLILGSGCGEDIPLPPEDTCQPNAVLDVRPGEYPNEVDLDSPGTLEVAVLGSDTLDARALDLATARLTDPDGSAEDVAPEATREEHDVDGDGRVDGVLRFSIPALTQAGVLHAEVSRLKLTARTLSGTHVEACDKAHAAGHLIVQLPAPTGPFAVGTTAYHWTDTARKERYTDAKDDVRELMARVWYPAEPRPGAQPAPYFLTRREGVGNTYAFEVDERFFDFVHAHAVADAPLSIAEPRYPVLLFSPGLGMPPTLYTSLLEELASQGYVVVALSHTFSSGVVVFPDGHVAPQTEGPSLWKPSKTDTLFGVWNEDASFALAQVVALEGEDPPGRFTHRLDLEHLGMLGHSFGGANAALACRQQRLLVACANLDGSFQGDFEEGVEQPFLLMTAGSDLDSSEKKFVQKMSGVQAGVARAAHGTFTDMPLLLPLVKHYQPNTDDGTFETGELGPRGTDIVRAYTRAFFDEHLRGQSSPLLEGPSSDFPEVELHHHSR